MVIRSRGFAQLKQERTKGSAVWKTLMRAMSVMEEKEKENEKERESVPASLTTAVAMVCHFCSAVNNPRELKS